MTKDERKSLTELSNKLCIAQRNITAAQEKINRILKEEEKTTGEKIIEKLK